MAWWMDGWIQIRWCTRLLGVVGRVRDSGEQAVRDLNVLEGGCPWVLQPQVDVPIEDVGTKGRVCELVRAMEDAGWLVD